MITNNFIKNSVNLLWLENRKCRRRGIWPVLLALLLFQGFYLSWSMGRVNVLPQGWIQQLYNLPLINSIMLPTVMAVLANRIMDIEHKGSTLKLLQTLQSKKSIFFGKALYGFCCILIFCLLQLGLTFLAGFHFGFHGSPDYMAYLLYFRNTLLVSFVLYLLQMLLSLFFSSQAAALSVGLCGSMAGLFLLYMPRSILYEIVPWGLYGATMFVGMDWDRAARNTDFYFTDPFPFSLCFVLLWIFLLLLIGERLYEKMEVDGFVLSGKTMSIHKKESSSSRRSRSVNTFLPAECIKLKRTPLWIAFLILPTISAVIGTFNYSGNIGILNDLWYSLWSQHSLFFSFFFMPPLIGMYCSYLWRLEHTGCNWNQLMVNVSPWKIVWDKLLLSCGITLLTTFWLAALYIVSGRYIGITMPLPPELMEWLILGFLGGMAICSVQIFLSLVIRNFAIPIAIALAGGIAGMLLSSKGFWFLLPYSLFSIGMRANNPHYQPDLIPFFTAFILFLGGFYLLSVWYLKKSDIITQ